MTIGLQVLKIEIYNGTHSYIYNYNAISSPLIPTKTLKQVVAMPIWVIVAMVLVAIVEVDHGQLLVKVVAVLLVEVVALLLV